MIVLEMIERLSESMAINMTISIVGAGGWFMLARWLFSEEGAAKVASWIA